MRRSRVLVIFVLILLVGFAVVKLGGGGSVPSATDAARHSLETQGFTDVNIRGIATMGCLNGDTFKFTFSATSPQGLPVSGNICGGGMSGWRPEYR